MNTNRFLNYLSGIYPVSPEFKFYLSQIINEELYVRNQVLLSAGQTANRLWYIEKGIAMEYSIKNGEKIPYRFWEEGDIMVDVSSFFKQVPSEGYIEILTTSYLQAINNEQMENLYLRFPETHIIFRSIIETYHNYSEKRALELLTLTAGERYQQLLQDSPFVLQQVSMENIAAYLGVSRKTLSRIRAKKKH